MFSELPASDFMSAVTGRQDGDKRTNELQGNERQESDKKKQKTTGLHQSHERDIKIILERQEDN